MKNGDITEKLDKSLLDDEEKELEMKYEERRRNGLRNFTFKYLLPVKYNAIINLK